MEAQGSPPPLLRSTAQSAPPSADEISAAKPCFVSFTGFRDDDDWDYNAFRESEYADFFRLHKKEEQKATRSREGDNVDDEEDHNLIEQEFYEYVALRNGARVPQSPTQPIHALVARRGFTRKRLHAALQHIPVVLPDWVTCHCTHKMTPTTTTTTTITSLTSPASSDQHKTHLTAYTAVISSAFAVPWLHGYVFATTGLSAAEKAAMHDICVREHGAEVEAALTYRCDVLLTNADCTRRLQALLRRDASGTNAAAAAAAVAPLSSSEGDTTTAAGKGGLRSHINTNVEALGSKKAAGAAAAAEVEDVSWLTDKLRFALEYDIPVVDYVKMFALLRLDRLPSPTQDLEEDHTASTGGGADAAGTLFRGAPDNHSTDGGDGRHARRSHRSVAWPRDVEEALKGNDFDTVIGICRVGAPRGGATRWRALLDSVAGPHNRRTANGLADGGGAVEGGNEEPELSDAASADELEHAGSDARDASSRTSSSSASTVSDPDAWEDFMQHALIPDFAARSHADLSTGGRSPASSPQRINAYPMHQASTAAARAALPECMTANTADVEVHPTPFSESHTLRESAADHFSATPVTDTLASMLGTATCVEPDSFHDTLALEAADCLPTTTAALSWGMSQVDPSPRLTTNVLLQRDTVPRPSVHGRSEVCGVKDGKADEQGDNFGDRIAAYYAAQRSEKQQQQQQQLGVAASAMAHVSETQSDATLPTSTQVLVDSCTAETTQTTPARAVQTSRGPAVQRVTLPLTALHPPYLNVSLLGCTAAEEQRAVVWCGVCRFLRTPFPTVETDVVILGSHVMTRKKYTVSASLKTREASTLRALKARQLLGKKTNSAAAAASHKAGKKSDHSGGAVCVRYWELDAVVARALADQCGIAASRIAPLRWLEDACAATRQAVAENAKTEEEHQRKTLEAAKNRAEMIKGSKNLVGSSTFTDAEATAVETVSSPQNTLADLVQECLEEQKANILPADTRAPVFRPLPALRPDQLPSLASPVYYIRVRHSAAANTAAPTATGARIPPAAQTGSAPPKVEGSSLDQQRTTATPAFRESAVSTVSAPSESNRSVGAAAAAESSLRNSLQQSSSLVALSSASNNAASASASVGTVEDGKSAVAVTPQPEVSSSRNSQQSYDAELETAGRRFNQLIALLHVEASGVLDGANGDAETQVAKAAKEEVARARRSVLQACYFCCAEGDFSRVDWAVIRGLLRYGGAHVEKKPAEEWERVLSKKSGGKKTTKTTKESAALSSASPGLSDEGEEVSAQQRKLAAAVRRNIEYEKQQRKLTRLLLEMQDNSTAAPASVTPQLTCSGDLATSSRETARATRAAALAEAVDNLKKKLMNTSRGCQQAPVFCLLPHSFQRTPAPMESKQSASTRPPTTSAAVASSPTTAALSSRLHSLSGLLRITQDYVLACLAVGYCLHPQSCFLFYTSIPSAPDIRLFQAPKPTAPLQNRLLSNSNNNNSSDNVGGSDRSVATSQHFRRPQLSVWMHERRYSKPESVGVCVSVLWLLPAKDSPWVTELPQIASPRPPHPSSPIPTVQLVSRQQEALSGGVAVPSPKLVPLLRVLMLGFRNAVESMGGHVADAFSPASVTHVVVVDLGALLATTLQDLYALGDATTTTEKIAAAAADADKTKETTKALGGGRNSGWSSSCYWPAEDVSDIVCTAARDDVSVVSMDWLAECTEWGAFVSEAGHAPPLELLQRIEEVQQQNLKQQRQQQQYSRGPRQRSSQLSVKGKRDALATKKRTRTPSPPLQQQQQQQQQPPKEQLSFSSSLSDPRRITAPPHTPPRPSVPAPPTSAFVSTHVPDDDGEGDGGASNGHDSHSRGGFHGARTPVMRRLLPPSASNSNSNVEPFTPPPRPPTAPTHGGYHLPQQSPAPPRPFNMTATPPFRSDSLSNSCRARSCRSASGSARRPRASPSASQHNTYSLADQQEAEAYVEHLGNMFNFCSPGSTPLPSSARRNRLTPASAHHHHHSHHHYDSQNDSGDGVPVLGKEHTPLPKTFQDQVFSQLLQRTGSGDGQPSTHDPANLTVSSDSQLRISPVKVSSRAGDDATPHRESQLSNYTNTQRERSASSALCTPRRRTLRGLAAASAAGASASATQRSAVRTPPRSPDRQRHRSDMVDSASKLAGEEKKTDSKKRRQGGADDAALVVLGGSTPLTRPTEKGSSEQQQQDGDNESCANSDVRASSPEQLVCERVSVNRKTQNCEGESQAAETNARECEEDVETWVEPTQSSTASSSRINAAQPSRQQENKNVNETFTRQVLCPFSCVPSEQSEDETTVPLPCVGPTIPRGRSRSSSEGVGRADGGQAATVFSPFMEDVIPDSQLDITMGADGQSVGILAPASFIEATRGACAPVEDDITGTASSSAAFNVTRAVHADRCASCDLLGEDEEMVNVSNVYDRGTRQTQAEGRRTTEGNSQHSSNSGNVGAAGSQGRARPRLEPLRSAPRQLSPSPVPPAPPPSPPAAPHRHSSAPCASTSVVVDVDADSSSNSKSRSTQNENTTQQRERCEGEDRVGKRAGTSPPPSTLPASPWATHRPLSLSRRPSHSPIPSARLQSPPPAPQPAERDDNDKLNKKTKKKKKKASVSKSADQCAVLHCLRVYVLHDLPHRETRVQRCCAALQRLASDHDSPLTPTIPTATAPACNAKEQQKTRTGRDTAASDRGKRFDEVEKAKLAHEAADEFSPPVCFVHRCEDADVCVTHEVSLRESVLVAVARGCWVVQPGYLECVAAIVDGCRHDKQHNADATHTHENGHNARRHSTTGSAATSKAATTAELQLQPHPLTVRSSTTTERCYQRLWEMCARYEWTLAAATATAIAGPAASLNTTVRPSAAPMSPMRRALVLQCRRQRLAAHALKGQGAAANGSAGVFLKEHFVLLSSATFADTAAESIAVPEQVAGAVKARLLAVRHVLTAGGGTVLSAVQVGTTWLSTSVRQCIGPGLSQRERSSTPQTPSSASVGRGSGIALRCSMQIDGQRDTAKNVVARRVVSDEDLYHDVVWLLCDAIARRCDQWKRRDPATSTSATTSSTTARSMHSSRNATSTVQQEEQRRLASSLVVLLDASLFDAAPVSVNDGNHPQKRSHSQQQQQHCCLVSRSTHHDNVESRGKRVAERFEDEASRPLSATGASRKRARPSSEEDPCTVGAWLTAWLPLRDNNRTSSSQQEGDDADVGASESDGDMSCGYTREAQYALRVHLLACCSLVYHLGADDDAEIVHTNWKQPTAPLVDLSSVAEKTWAYSLRHLPFAVPTLDEILCVYSATDATRAAIARRIVAKWEMTARTAKSNRQRVEFRSTSWVGACVAAGGSAAITASTSKALCGVREAESKVEQSTWRRECEAQTLFAALEYA